MEVFRVPTQQILARNDAQQSENRIHSDEVASRYGFRSALVSGVNVFGYLSQPLVSTYGEAWLQRGLMDVLFLKPAYENDLLTITTEGLGAESSERNCLTSATNEQGQLLAKLESWLPLQLPAPNPLAQTTCGDQRVTREEISWDAIGLGKPDPLFPWRPSAEENAQHVEVQRDRARYYQGETAYLHPYYLLDACNRALMRRYVMPAWLHTGSKLILRAPLRVNNEYQIKSIPIDKWERKGHQFVKIYVAFWQGESLVLEVEHSAIFRLAS